MFLAAIVLKKYSLLLPPPSFDTQVGGEAKGGKEDHRDDMPDTKGEYILLGSVSGRVMLSPINTTENQTKYKYIPG